MELIKDMPSGPLDEYRNLASFNWKQMKSLIYSVDDIKLQNAAYTFLEEDPLFHMKDDEDSRLEEKRRLTLLRMKKLLSVKSFYPDDFYTNMHKSRMLNIVVGSYDWSLFARKGLLKDFALSTLVGMGTEGHMEYVSAVLNDEIGFAFCLTEIGHGSNTKGMRTEARFDSETNRFIIHTPDFEAAKCWAGCLGKLATHCLVFAQLYDGEGQCHGLHCFVVPIRDRLTMTTFLGVTVIDMGPKLGMNGVDNGVVLFNRYSIPRENLLNRTGDVTAEGVYVSPYKDPNKRHGASFGNLSLGRVSIVYFCATNIQKALTIALRYSAVRKQFGPSNNVEVAIIEYPLTQWRLFPYLGGLYILNTLSVTLTDHYINFRDKMMEGGDQEFLALFGQEIHALSCVVKPLASWLARDAIQECREACGGHGYLQVSGFGPLREDNDANCTYEGDNNVILQQTSTWLISLWNRRERMTSSFPMGTIDYLFGESGNTLLSLRWPRTAFQPSLSNRGIIDLCLEAYGWVVCWLCQASGECLSDCRRQGDDPFSAKNRCQIYRAHSLALAYGERVMVAWFKDFISTVEEPLRSPLERLCALFAITRLLKHTPIMIEGGFLSTHGMAVGGAHAHVQRLLSEILPDAVALIDVFAPPDFILRSALGNADGKVYEHLYRAMTTAKGALTKDPTVTEIDFYKISKL